MTQAIDELLGEVTSAVSASTEQTTASQALAQEVAGKMGAIDAKVAAKEEEVDNFIQAATPEKRFVQTIKIGGSSDYLYPVFWQFPSNSFGVGKLEISRSYHWDKPHSLSATHVASLLMQMEGNAAPWSGDANYIKLSKYSEKYNNTASHLQFGGFAYRESLDDNPPAYGADGYNYVYSGVYLRGGGLTYRLSSNWVFSPIRLNDENDVNNTRELHTYLNTRFMVKPIPFSEQIIPVEG
jgi:hypothetical protein